MSVSIGIAVLGAASSGIAGSQGTSRSTAATIALIVIGLLIAAFTAVSQAVDARGTAAVYRRDELHLRHLGWHYLRELEEGATPDIAYSNFLRTVTDALDREHPQAFASESRA